MGVSQLRTARRAQGLRQALTQSAFTGAFGGADEYWHGLDCHLLDRVK